MSTLWSGQAGMAQAMGAERELGRAVGAVRTGEAARAVGTGRAPETGWALGVQGAGEAEESVARGPALIGRGREFGRLIDLIRDATTGRGRIAVIQGEPGIGKTALVRAVSASARGFGVRVAVGSADTTDRRRPFGVLVDALGVDAGSATARGRSIAARLAGQPADDPAQARGALGIGEQLQTLIDELCAECPLVLVLEDVHWADPATIDWLTHFARSVPGLPVMVLCTARPLPRSGDLSRLLAALAASGGDELQLAALADPDWHTLASALIGAEPSCSFLDRLAGAGGNPLFLRTIVGALLRDGAVTVTDGVATTASDIRPPSLGTAILHHLSYLDLRVRDVLGLAAVLGNRFLVSDLALIAEVPLVSLWGLLRDAIAAGLLDDDGGGRLAFQHELIRGVLYRDLPHAVRLGMHRDIAAKLELSGAAAGSVAEHLLRASESGDPRLAVDLVRCAGGLAELAPATADVLLERALELTPAGDAAVGTRLARARVAVRLGRLARAESLCRRLLSAPGAADQEGRVRALLANTLLHQRRPLEAERQAALADAAGGLTPSERAYNLAVAATAPTLCGQLWRVPELADRAYAAAVSAGNAAAQARALAIRGHAAHCRGELSQAEQTLRAAVTLVSGDTSAGVPESSALLLCADVLIDLDRIGEAQRLYQRALRAAEDFGAAGEQWRAQLIARATALATGRFDDAVVAIDVLLDLAPQIGMGLWSYQLQRAHLTLYLDGPEAASGWLRRFDELGIPEPGGYYGATAGLQGRAAYLLARGDSAGALRTLLRAWRDTAVSGIVIDRLRLGPDLAELAVRGGDDDLAAEAVAGVDALASANASVVAVQAVAARCRGLASADPELLTEAVRLYRQTSRRWDLARTAESAALALARAGRRREAAALAAEALGIHAELGTDWDGARARAALRAAGIRPGVRGKRARPATGWASLTPAEVNVAELVTQGMSNPQVAEVLFLSRRTVRCHLSHIFTKLDIHSRGELADVALSRDDGPAARPPVSRAAARSTPTSPR